MPPWYWHWPFYALAAARVAASSMSMRSACTGTTDTLVDAASAQPAHGVKPIQRRGWITSRRRSRASPALHTAAALACAAATLAPATARQVGVSRSRSVYHNLPAHACRTLPGMPPHGPRPITKRACGRSSTPIAYPPTLTNPPTDPRPSFRLGRPRMRRPPEAPMHQGLPPPAQQHGAQQPHRGGQAGPGLAGKGVHLLQVSVAVAVVWCWSKSCAVLCHAVLFCAVLCCAVLCRAVLRCAALCCAALCRGSSKQAVECAGCDPIAAALPTDDCEETAAPQQRRAVLRCAEAAASKQSSGLVAIRSRQRFPPTPVRSNSGASATHSHP